MHDHDGWNGNDGYDDLGSLSMLLGLIILFLFILAAAYGVKWVLGQRTPSSTAHGETALDLLKKRYARGEKQQRRV